MADDDGGGDFLVLELSEGEETVTGLQICGLIISLSIFAVIGLAFVFGACEVAGEADDEAERQLEEMRK